MAWTRTKTFILLSLFLLIVIGSYFTYQWPALTINGKLSQDAYNILLKYVFIILVCERSLSVYNAINYEGKKLAIERRIKYFREKIANFLKLDDKQKAEYKDDDPAFKEMIIQRSTNTPDINYLNLIELEELKLEEVGEQARKFSMRALMFFGSLLAIGGLSVLGDLISFDELWLQNANVFQKRLIKFIDILLTGALIGGGSKSFHELLSTIQEVLKRVKEGPKTN